MKIVLQVLLLTFIVNFTYAQSEKKLSEEFSIVLRPLIDNTTGLNDSSYSLINKELPTFLDDRFEVSEFKSFPLVLFASCASQKSMAVQKKVVIHEVDLAVNLFLVDLVSKKSYGEKLFTLKGSGDTEQKALSNALKELKGTQNEAFNSFVYESYGKLLFNYQNNCQENLLKLNEPSPMMLPEDNLIKLISFPEMIPECKSMANTELVLKFDEFGNQKCEELNYSLKMALEEKDEKNAELFLTKMSYLGFCDELIESNKEALLKMEINTDKIEAKTKKMRFNPELENQTNIDSKISNIILLVRDEQMGDDPGMSQMIIEEANVIIRSEETTR